MLYSPDSILLQVGPVTIYWYGVIMALGLLAGLVVSIKIAAWYGIAKETIIDLFFYLVIFGFLGARLFFVLYNLPHFLAQPLDVFKIWEGGIGIHGGIVAGAVVVWWFARARLQNVSLRAQVPRSGNEAKQSRDNSDVTETTGSPRRPDYGTPRDDTKNNFWLLAATITPGLALGQAIGRWGNFFNQELFGLPSNLPWAIPIDAARRPEVFSAFTHFHPTFLYESVGNVLIFGTLLYLHRARGMHSQQGAKLIVFAYITLYSLVRFATEMLRLDPVGTLGGVRVTMLLAMAGVVLGVSGLVWVWRERAMGQ